MPTMIPLICSYCNTNFLKLRHQHLLSTYKKHSPYCSIKCYRKYQASKRVPQISCTNCNKFFAKQNSQIKKSKFGNHFCSQSCAATYNNKHKTHGTRRSKLEVYIESKIKLEFPNLEFKANDKSVINSELDFYFPNLKLAIEINGPLHYKPIYGKDKLIQIQNNDSLKRVACNDANIKLVIVDNLKNHGKLYANERWNIIKNYLYC